MFNPSGSGLYRPPQSSFQRGGSSGGSTSVSSAYSTYEMQDSLLKASGGSFVNVSSRDNGLAMPTFEQLNPYARAGSSASARDERRWQPVPDLLHSKETLQFRRGVGKILKKVHEEISPAELEIRAHTPEFKVHEDDWVAHTEKNQRSFITPLKTVARIPANLIMSDQLSARNNHENDISGYLRKRGERNRAYQRRYMELNGNILSYYKKKPEKNGVPLSREEKKNYERGFIDLDRVSSIQPIDLQSEPFGIHLVTTSRTWSLAAESAQEYERWLKSLCSVVKFSAVHSTFKRRLLLQEVSAKAVTDVRMVIATGDTVGQIVEHIFNCYKMKLDAAPLKPYDPSNYVLKVTGYRDYMTDRFRVMNEYMHVRDCLLSKKTLRLTLVHESVIQETAIRSMSIRTDLPLNNAFSNQLFDLSDHDRGSLQMTTLGDDWERSSSGIAVASGIVREPFAIKIHRVLNIPRHTAVLKRTSEEASVEYRRLSTESVIVRIELFDAGELLESAQFETPDVRLVGQPRGNLLYAEWVDPLWHRFNIDVADIVRTMRIQLSVIGVKRVIGSKTQDDYEEKILVTGINVFEVDGLLVQGPHYAAMYNNLHSCKQDNNDFYRDSRMFDPTNDDETSAADNNDEETKGRNILEAIKFENHHLSALAMMLIERAIKNPNQIGFDLFWSMKVESYNPQYRERYGTILNTYLDVCSQKMRHILKLQDKLFSADGMFARICHDVKQKKKDGSDEMKRVMREGLEALNEILPNSFQLPIDPRIEVGKIIVSKCRVMDSAKKPLWLVFENAEEGGDPVTVIFKAGDDVRQDCLTLQLIRLMDEMWREEGLDLAMEPYKCITANGRYFHIDFGHFLGHFKYQMGVKRERTPFVFTREMAHVLGGTDSHDFSKFIETCCEAYNVVRKHMHLLVSLLLLMIPADMPELTGRDDINHLVTMIGPELTEEQARASFTDLVYFCLDNKFKRFDNTIHILAHVLG
ncbi:hypothetical protein P43SY_001070 [Pythium insidiosum]|uniref:phosphatidylinositol 3-kinase n=1 Tax=Pythium insidiosum TaxID=114742 RepID=A0AAD5M807_PYTIN|nr:hypothetical protein P43SY_001070 [Pythium insidiosum]